MDVPARELTTKAKISPPAGFGAGLNAAVVTVFAVFPMIGWLWPCAGPEVYTNRSPTHWFAVQVAGESCRTVGEVPTVVVPPAIVGEGLTEVLMVAIAVSVKGVPGSRVLIQETTIVS